MIKMILLKQVGLETDLAGLADHSVLESDNQPQSPTRIVSSVLPTTHYRTRVEARTWLGETMMRCPLDPGTKSVAVFIQSRYTLYSYVMLGDT